MSKIALDILKSYSSGGIYFNSNEDLENILSQVDIKNKNILTVLGSGDQTFHMYNNGASHVDMFDVNNLTIHYFYLRIWIMKYYKTYYPKICFGKDYLQELLANVEPSTLEEKKSCKFWKILSVILSDEDLIQMFYVDRILQNNIIEDFSTILKKSAESSHTFYNVDILKSKMITKKYDVIYTSNISELIQDTPETYILYRDRLDSLLTDCGMIISANVRYYNTSLLERDIFSEKFDYVSLDVSQNSVKPGANGYVYYKK